MRSGEGRTGSTKPFSIHQLTTGAMFEALEPRVMLDATLETSRIHILAAQASGTTLAAEIQLISGGFQYKGSVTAELFEIPNGTFNAATFDPATAVKLNTVKLKIDVPSVGEQDLPLPVALPANVAAGEYQVVGRLTGKGLAPVLILSDELTVTQPNYDLVPTPDTGKSVIPAALVANSGKPTNGKVAVQLTNTADSTATIPAKLNAATQVVLRQEGHDDIVISAKPGKSIVGGLAPGTSSKAVNIAITLPGDLAAGTYQVVVKIDSGSGVGALAETNESNNEVVVRTISVADPFVNLGVAVNAAQTKLPTAVIISGSATAKATLALTATNNGNVPTDKTQTVDVAVVVKPVGGGAAVATIPFNDLKFGKVLNGEDGNISLVVNLPAGIPDGAYILEATVTGVTGDNLADNTAATSNATPLNVQEGRILLTIATATDSFGATAVGSSAGKGGVTFKNDGNVPMVGQVKVQFYASLTLSTAGLDPIGESAVSVNLAPGATLSKPVSVDLILPNPNSTTTLNIIAVVAALNFTDSAPPDNHTTSSGSVSVSKYTPIFPSAVGDVITFHASQTINGVGQFQQSGTFSGSNGATGDFNMTYTTGGTFGGITFPESGILGLTGSAPALRQIRFYSHHGVSFSGKTVRFNYESAGAIGEITGFEGGVIGYIHFG